MIWQVWHVLVIRPAVWYKSVEFTVLRQTWVNFYKVKVRLLRSPSKFGHIFANSGNPDETALDEPSHKVFHCLPS